MATAAPLTEERCRQRRYLGGCELKRQGLPLGDAVGAAEHPGAERGEDQPRGDGAEGGLGRVLAGDRGEDANEPEGGEGKAEAKAAAGRGSPVRLLSVGSGTWCA